MFKVQVFASRVLFAFHNVPNLNEKKSNCLKIISNHWSHHQIFLYWLRFSPFWIAFHDVLCSLDSTEIRSEDLLHSTTASSWKTKRRKRLTNRITVQKWHFYSKSKEVKVLSFLWLLLIQLEIGLKSYLLEWIWINIRQITTTYETNETAK